MSDRPKDDAEGRSSGGGRSASLARRNGEELLIGRLVAHGRANYQFRSEEDPSYFVKLLTSRGPRILWGKDLERALAEAETRPQAGQLIGARRQSREAVTVTQKYRDDAGKVISQTERTAHRSLWVVEKVTYFAERARLARQLRDDQLEAKAEMRAHPELRTTFLSIRAAEEFARKKIVNPQDQAKFLELIRGVLAGNLERGEPMPSVRLRTPARGISAAPKVPGRDGPSR